MMKENKSFNRYIEEAVRNHWDMPAFTDYQGTTYHYKDVARRIAKIHIMFDAADIRPGDKVAICGRNSSNWAIAFCATLTYGAIVVPILHEFKPDNVHHIVNHSEAKFLFVGDVVWENLNETMMPGLNAILLLNDLSLLKTNRPKLNEARARLNEFFGKAYPVRFRAEDIRYYSDQPEELAMINYTSGSTGFSKGVMLPYRSLWSNLKFCNENLDFLKPGDSCVSMLPMAHMYGLTVELLNPLAKGCHIFFLTRTPSPKIIMEAFAQIKPKLIVAVPLIIEKIIKTKVFPLLDKPLVKLMLMMPFVDSQLLLNIKNRLTETFGGNLKEMIIGGAALNKDVEEFLRRIEFPFTVGYGMTECGPLISYAPWQIARSGSCGKAVQRMELKINSSDPANIVGELWVRGDNVMSGYYKNNEITRQVLKDGWLNTGDLATIDKDGFLYLRGRSKNMILGPSGQNIYPEEIEDVLNNMPYVNESIVIEQEGKLTALIYPDFENADKAGYTREQVEKLMEENRIHLNKELPVYAQISKIKIYYEEFEKTPKRSIKRYLYTNV